MEEEKTQSLLTNLMESSSANFRNLNSSLHMVLFLNTQLFDYLPITREIRPYNSGHWYKILDGKYDNFLNYLENIYYAIDPLKPENKEEEYTIMIGYKVENILSIDLDKMIGYLSEITRVISEDNLYNINMKDFDQETRILITECYEFSKRLSEIYQYWDCICPIKVDDF